MTHETHKPLADKHPGKTPDPRIEAAVSEKIVNGKLPCLVASNIARNLNVTLAAVGVTSDLLNIKISKCQLGLFGYQPKSKVAADGKEPAAPLKAAIESAASNQRITCETAWDIAARLKVGKIAVGNACETMGIKIKNCQFGTFK